MKRESVMNGKGMMVGSRLQVVVAMMLVLQLGIGQAASAVIGVAVARGTFQLDRAAVAGNGTLFEGTVVETGKATGELKMSNGARMLLGEGSRGKVYRGHLVLEQGVGQLEGGGYMIEAGKLQVEAVSSGRAKVALRGGNRVLVAAYNGPVRVRTGSGIVVATLAAGKAVVLEPMGQETAATVTGELKKAGGVWVLTDKGVGQTFELRGLSGSWEAGKVLQVSGTLDPKAKPAGGADQVLNVHQSKPCVPSKDGAKEVNGKDGKSENGAVTCAAVAGAAAAGAGAAGAGAAGGAAAGAATAGAVGAAAAGISTTAVVAGVVVAGVAAGVAVGVTQADDKPISQ